MAKVRTISGDELSGQDIESLAEEAQRGYDLTAARRERVGRLPLGKTGLSPRLDAYDQRMQTVPLSLPGHELVSAGLADLAEGRESESSLLVAMAAPRLRTR